jgi:hypothetical protein
MQQLVVLDEVVAVGVEGEEVVEAVIYTPPPIPSV